MAVVRQTPSDWVAVNAVVPPPQTIYDPYTQQYYCRIDFTNGTYCFFFQDGTISDANNYYIDADISEVYDNASYCAPDGTMHWIPHRSTSSMPDSRATGKSFISFTLGDKTARMEWSSDLQIKTVDEIAKAAKLMHGQAKLQ